MMCVRCGYVLCFRYDFLQKMLLPCGIPPKAADAEDEDEEMAEATEDH